jgi:parallel beta-helix repeat protein
MRRICRGAVPLTLLLLMTIAAGAEDAVLRAGGVVAGNTIWEGRVEVEREVTVSDNAVLTIRPGTSVSFRKGTGLVVGGALIAKGSREAPIRFHSAEKVPERGDWAGIRLQGGNGATILERCGILHAATAIAVGAGAPAIRDCEITAGATGVEIERNASPVVSGNRITKMTEGGIVSMMGASPTIERNALVECVVAGIFAANNSAPAVRGNTVERCGKGLLINGTIPPVEGNIFRKNGDGLQMVQSGQEQIIRGNRFEGNEVGLRCENFSAPLVEENEFVGNGDAIFCFQASSPMIRRNGITGNRRGIACSRISSPIIVANEIRENGKGIHLTLSSYAVVNGNNFEGNEVQIELDDMSSDWEHRVRKKPERGAQAQLATRISRGKATREELAANQDDRAALMDAVDATGNWWGVEDTEEMEKKGPAANLRRLVDGYDVPVRTYVGFPGEYAQDRIRYDNWKKSRIPDAGVPTKGKGTGK